MVRLLVLLTALLTGLSGWSADKPVVPAVDGKWWKIAGDNPDVAPFTIVEDGSSNVCDFTG